MDAELIMSLYEMIIEEYPELADSKEIGIGSIILRNDSDGTGDYIAKWEYSKPVPASLVKYVR
jgi:hypothetical protein